MNWQVKFKTQAVDELKELDRQAQVRILKFVKRLETYENPKYLGAPLHGNLSKFWKYRVGDYRLICNFDYEKLEVSIIKLSHRKNVYKEK
jgi:mRNA interferase RelE/StbE